jgi:hypothetical protein
MSKYSNRFFKPMEKSFLTRTIHPIWRGVGFGFMVIIPFMAYFLAELFLKENASKGWINIPVNWYIMSLPDPALLIKIGATIGMAGILYLIITMFFFLVYRLFAPPRYGPLDVPPVTYKGRPYKR